MLGYRDHCTLPQSNVRNAKRGRLCVGDTVFFFLFFLFFSLLFLLSTLFSSSVLFRMNGIGLAEASKPSREASPPKKEHFTSSSSSAAPPPSSPPPSSGGAADDSPPSLVRFSKEYLAEVREMEAALQGGGTGGFDDDEDDGRSSSFSSSRTVKKKFWGKKEERIEDLAFILSPVVSPMSMMFRLGGGGEPGGKKRMGAASGTEGEEDDDYYEEEDDVRMDAEGHHQYVFPMVFGNMFKLESSRRLRRAHRRRPPTYQEDYLQEEKEAEGVMVANETLDHHDHHRGNKSYSTKTTPGSSGSNRRHGGASSYSGEVEGGEDGVGGIEGPGYINVDSAADMEQINTHLNSLRHSAPSGGPTGVKKEKEEERRRRESERGGGGWGTSRPPPRSGTGGSLRESRTLSERGWHRKQLAQARKKPHEDGCYTTTIELLHRVRKVRRVLEEAFTDALNRYSDLTYEFPKWKRQVEGMTHPYPQDALPSPLQRDSKTHKEVQEGEKEEEGKKVNPSSSSSSLPSALPEAHKIRGKRETENAIRLEQWEMSIRHNKRKLEAARSALKEFDDRTWSGLGAKLAPRCLGEAARYRFYLLHRELPSMTVAPLPPPLIFSDSKEDDDNDVGEEAEDEAEAERRWLEKEMDKEEDDVDEDDEEAPDMIQEKMWLVQRLRESRRMEREQRKVEKRRKATREGVREGENEEEEEDEAKEEEELEQLSRGKFKKFLQDRVRERRRSKREALRQRLLEEWRSRRRKTSSSSSDASDMEKERRRRRKGDKSKQGDDLSLLLNTAKRSKHTLDPSVKVRPLKETEYMTLSQVLQQCKVFARNQVYGVVLPPLYLFWQLSSAVFRFYFDELSLTFSQSMPTYNSSNISTNPTSSMDHIVGDNTSHLFPKKRGVDLDDPAHHALHLPDASIPPPPVFYGPEGFPLCSSRRSPKSFLHFLLQGNEKHDSVRYIWVMTMGAVIFGVIIAPVFLLVIFFYELLVNVIGYPFFLQYALRLRQDPLSVLKNALVEELLRHRNPSEVLRVGKMWYTAVVEAFHHDLPQRHHFRNIQRWWNWQTEEFLCLSFIVVSITASWLIWRGCIVWMRFFLFRWSVMYEQHEEVEEEKSKPQKRGGEKKTPSPFSPPPMKKRQELPPPSPPPRTQEQQLPKKKKKTSDRQTNKKTTPTRPRRLMSKHTS